MTDEQKIIELPSNDTVTITVNENNINKVKYTFKNSSDVKIGEYEKDPPASLSIQSAIGKQFKQCIDPDGDFKPTSVNKKFAEFKQLMQLKYEFILKQREQELIQAIADSEEDNTEKKKEAGNKLKEINQFYNWLGSRVDWLTAGERNNIVYAFTVYASQIILKNPISLIPLGDSSSGKTHIQSTALDLMPKDYVVNEKNITQAAFFLRAEQDKYFYDGKIVNYGDMGGDNDQEFMEQSKALMKELQSDGYLKRPKGKSDNENGWVLQELELIGRPCLTYTTVPNYQFDDQELSRSLIITPRTDNKKEYQKMKRVLEFKGGYSDKCRNKYKKELEIVPYMLLHLKDELEDVEIVNPYVSIVEKILDNSHFYKRDHDKYNGLLKTVTALNYYNHKIIEKDSHKILFTTLADVQLFVSMIQPYMRSISSNLPPKAVEILNDYMVHKDEWRSDLEDLTGITISEYFELHSLGLARGSIGTYFKMLRDTGYLKIVGQSGNANIYDVTDLAVNNVLFNLEDLDDSIFDDICKQYNNDLEVQNLLNNDKYVDGLSVAGQDDDVPIPEWLK